MRTTHRLAICLLALGMFWAATGIAAKKPLSGIPLVWKPTSVAGDFGAVDLTGLAGVKIEIRDFSDAREHPDLIGENRDKEDEGIVLGVTASESVPRFVTDHLRRLFADAGVDTVAEGGTTVVTGEVRRFFVLETSAYAGEVSLKLEVKDKEGKVHWAGMAGGTAKRFGRSYKAENYYETLSDALMAAAYKLLQNKSFMQALSEK